MANGQQGDDTLKWVSFQGSITVVVENGLACFAAVFLVISRLQQLANMFSPLF